MNGCRPSGPAVVRLLLAVLLLMNIACAPSAEHSPVQRGLYYWGHEVNVVCDCSGDDCYWVQGERALLDQLRAFVQAQTTPPYQPVFLTYTGRILDQPTDGFAADYEGYREISTVRTLSADLPEDCPAPS